jgi:hypothetical protein
MKSCFFGTKGLRCAAESAPAKPEFFTVCYFYPGIGASILRQVVTVSFSTGLIRGKRGSFPCLLSLFLSLAQYLLDFFPGRLDLGPGNVDTCSTSVVTVSYGLW